MTEETNLIHRPQTSSVSQRSAVKLWRSGRSRRYSVTVVDGTTREELDRLVALATGAADQIESAGRRPIAERAACAKATGWEGAGGTRARTPTHGGI